MEETFIKNLLDFGKNRDVYGIWTTTHSLTSSQLHLLEITPGTLLWAGVVSNTGAPSLSGSQFRYKFAPRGARG